MRSESFNDVWEAAIRAHGWGRWFLVAFLGLWLSGWVMGEVAGVGLLLVWAARAVAPGIYESFPLEQLPQDLAVPPPMVGWFVMVWLAFWTLGGVAAIWMLLRALWGRDVVRVGASELESVRRAWPFSRRRAVPLSEVVRFDLVTRQARLVVHTRRETLTLSDLGTPADRQAMRDALTQQLGTRHAVDDGRAVPAGWTVGHEGGPRLRLQREGAWGARWTVAAIIGLLSSVGLWKALQPETLPLQAWGGGVVSVIFLFGAAWIGNAQERWLLLPGRVERERTFLGLRFLRGFDRPTLRVETRRDSEGHEHCRLLLQDGAGSQTIESQVNGDDQVMRLARWLEKNAGLRIEHRATR